MKNKFNWKFFPIEFFALIPPAFILLLILIISAWLNKINLVKILSHFFSLVCLLGGHKLFIAFILLWLMYALALLLSYYLNIKHPGRTKAATSLLYITIISSLISIILGICVEIIFYLSTISDVIAPTLALDSLERSLFGNLLAVPFINAFSGSVWERLFLYSYSLMYIIFSLAIFFLALNNKKIFKTVILAFFLALIISLPIWAFFPATSPDGLYIAKIFGNNFQITSTNFRVSEFFAGMISYFHEIWISKDGQFINVSSLPSMHIAWSTIIIIGLALSKKRIFWFFGAWFLLNFIGAFYSLQHYFIDLIAGFLLGGIVYLLSMKLIRVEEKYYLGQDFYYISDFLIECKNLCKKL